MEVCYALQLHVFQGRQPGHKRVTPEQAAAALAIFRDELSHQVLLRPAALATLDLERQSEELSLRHTANHGFRTYDLLHVSSALPASRRSSRKSAHWVSRPAPSARTDSVPLISTRVWTRG
jgi:hypothetical protein